MKKFYLLLLAAVVGFAATAQDYYLIGNLNSWSLKDESLKFTKDGSVYKLTVAKLVSEFKINDGTWGNPAANFGAKDTTPLKPGVPFSLWADGGSKNILLGESISNATLIFNPEGKSLVITGNSQTNEYSVVYIFGNFGMGESWNTPADGIAMTQTSTDVWSAQVTFQGMEMGEASNYFKFQAGEFTYAPEGEEADTDVEIGTTYTAARNGNSKAFKMADGKYTITFSLPFNGESGTFTVAGQETPVTLPVPEKLYMVGDVNGTKWSTAAGVELTKAGSVFSAEGITIDDAGEGYGYATFTTLLAAEWDGSEGAPGVNSSDRFGAPTADAMMDELIPGVLTYYKAGVNASSAQSWKIPAGKYDVTADFEAKTVTLKVNTAAELTAADNGVAEFFNLQGVRVANPTNGLYIRRQGGVATKVLVK